MNTSYPGSRSVLAGCLIVSVLLALPTQDASAQDATPPELVYATMVAGEDSIFRLRYNEPVFMQSALDPFNYYVDLQDGSLADFATFVAPLDEEGITFELAILGTFDSGTDYFVRAVAVTDLAGNVVMPTAVAIQPVPEPGMLALGALGLFGAWMRWGRRRAD